MDPRPLSPAGLTGGGFAADSRSLDGLRAAAARDPAQAIHQVAVQFEALFMQMVLKSMREAMPRSSLGASQDQETYQGMLDQQLASRMAGSGTGLAAVIERQLRTGLPAAAASDGTVRAGASPAADTGGRVAARAAQAYLKSPAPTP
jgi:flagellar protein FlgJ